MKTTVLDDNQSPENRPLDGPAPLKATLHLTMDLYDWNMITRILREYKEGTKRRSTHDRVHMIIGKITNSLRVE